MEEDPFMDFGDDDDDLDWLYAEDDYTLADELAETQIAEPGYAGTGYEIELESYDYEFFAYWGDVEYGTDSYWDGEGGEQSVSIHVGQKRKMGSERSAQRIIDKRRRVSLKDTGGGNVVFVSLAERARRFEESAPLQQGKAAWALLPDWRQKCVDDGSAPGPQRMPAEMRRAAEADLVDSPLRTRPSGESAGTEDILDDGKEDGEEASEGEDDEEDGDLPDIDPEMLKAVLKQRLGDAGLDGMDEAVFMQTIAKMLSGGGDADDAAGELADSLLGQTTAGKDDAVSGWLSRQGVSLPNTTTDEDETPDDDVSSLKPLPTSTPDSAIDVSKAFPIRAETSKSPIARPAKKRARDTEDENDSRTATKRANTASDATPTAANATATGSAAAAPQKGARKRTAADEGDVEDAGVDAAPPAPKRRNRKAAPELDPPPRPTRARGAKAAALAAIRSEK